MINIYKICFLKNINTTNQHPHLLTIIQKRFSREVRCACSVSEGQEKGTTKNMVLLLWWMCLCFIWLCFHRLWPEFGFLSHQAALYLAPQHRDCLKMRHSGVNVLDFCPPIYQSEILSKLTNKKYLIYMI